MFMRFFLTFCFEIISYLKKSCKNTTKKKKTPYIFHPCAVLCFVAQSCPTLCDPMGCTLPGSSVHGDTPGKITRVGSHALLQGVFPTQESNLGLLCLLH